MTKALIEKYESGNGVTDAECLTLYRFFAELEQSLRLLGPKYHLAWLPVMLNKQAVEGFLVARNMRFNFR